MFQGFHNNEDKLSELRKEKAEYEQEQQKLKKQELNEVKRMINFVLECYMSSDLESNKILFKKVLDDLLEHC